MVVGLFCLRWLSLEFLFAILVVVLDCLVYLLFMFGLLYCCIIVLLDSTCILLLDVCFYCECGFPLVCLFVCRVLFGVLFEFDLRLYLLVGDRCLVV